MTFHFSSQTDLVFKATGDKSKFDELLENRWNFHMQCGHFRYPFSSPVSKIVPGTFGFIAQFNSNRASNRRPPQVMTSLVQGFNPDGFNFTKIDPDRELLFQLENSTRSGDAKHSMIINVSPLEKCSSLLVPEISVGQPQILTQKAITVGLETILLSGKSSLKLGFNSLCAFASVNHQHWHIYYIEGYSLYLESAPVSHFSGDCFLVLKYPAPCFAFQVRSVEDIDRIAASIHRLTQYLTQKEIAHNVFMTRGRDFNPDSTEQAVRIFVWARNSIIGSKDPGAFVIAVCELGGQILIYDEDDYNSITEERIVAAQSEATQEVFEKVRGNVKDLFTAP